MVMTVENMVFSVILPNSSKKKFDVSEEHIASMLHDGK
jgi:hypothetical protein